MKISAAFLYLKIVELKLSAVQFSDLSRRLRATLPEGESFSAEREGFSILFHIPPSWNTFIQPAFFCRAGILLPLPFKFAALHILYNCFTDFSLLNNFSGCII